MRFYHPQNAERGLIHVFAMLAVAAIMLITYVKIQDFVADTLAARKAAFKASVKNDIVLSPVNSLMHVDGERYRVSRALGFAPSKAEMLARISKMSDDERAEAAKQIGQVIKQPPNVPLEKMLDLAEARWSAIDEYAAAQRQSK